MTPIDFPEANMTLGLEGMKNLPVYKRTDGHFVSAWMPSKEEREEIAKGAPVMLYVVGDGHPPVALKVA